MRYGFRWALAPTQTTTSLATHVYPFSWNSRRPYDAQFPEHPSEIVERLRAWGAALTAETVSISDVFAEKLRLVSLYASQFKIEVVEREILASAEGEGPRGSRAEHLWTLERLPISIDTFELSVDRKERSMTPSRCCDPS